MSPCRIGDRVGLLGVIGRIASTVRELQTRSPLWRTRPGKGQSNSGAGISSLSGLGPTSPHHPVLRTLSIPMENSRQRHDTACQRKKWRGSSGSAQHGKCRAGERPASRRQIGDVVRAKPRGLWVLPSEMRPTRAASPLWRGPNPAGRAHGSFL